VAPSRAQADAGINFKHYVEMTQAAERAKFDMVFWPIMCACAKPIWKRVPFAQYNRQFRTDHAAFALSALTTHIGLVATALRATTNHFTLRKFASLDHLSGGRAG